MTIGETAGVDRSRLRTTVEDFLFAEAELLDDGRLHDWLTMFADVVDYRIPVRTSRARVGGKPAYSESTCHLICDRGSLEARVSRFDTGYAWAEETASRTRRIVGNVRVKEATETSLSVRSNFHVFRARDDFPGTLIAGERHDVLVRSAGGLRIAERTVYLDHTYLPTENLAIMF